MTCTNYNAFKTKQLGSPSERLDIHPSHLSWIIYTGFLSVNASSSKFSFLPSKLSMVQLLRTYPNSYMSTNLPDLSGLKINISFEFPASILNTTAAAPSPSSHPPSGTVSFSPSAPHLPYKLSKLSRKPIYFKISCTYYVYEYVYLRTLLTCL